MKLCGRDTMTQRSSILLGLSVLMVVFVERTEGFFLNTLIAETTTEDTPISTTINQMLESVDSVKSIDTNDDDRNDNQTEKYFEDIQMNFIDSEPNNLVNENDKTNMGETNSEEPPIVIDLGYQFENDTFPVDKSNATANENENVGNANESRMQESTKPEVQQIIIENESNATEIHENDSDASGTDEKTENIVPLAETTEPNEEPISTFASPSMNNSTEMPTHVEEATTNIDILQNTHIIPTPKPDKIQDLSIFFENEPNRARQLRGFSKEADNEIIPNSDNEPVSEFMPKISNTSEPESHNRTISSDASTGKDDNPAGEHISITETPIELVEKSTDQQVVTLEPDVKNVSSNTLSTTEQLTEVAVDDPRLLVGVEEIEEIPAVTESIEQDTNVTNKVEHTVYKKPGADEEIASPNNVTNDLIRGPVNEIPESTQNNDLESVKTFEVSPNPKGYEETLTDNHLVDSSDPVQTTTKEVETNPIDVEPVTVKSYSVNKTVSEREPVSKTKSLPERVQPEEGNKIEDKFLELPIESPEKQLKSVLELPRSLKPHPENSSITMNDVPIPKLNGIPIFEGQGKYHHLLGDVETSTQSTPIQSNEVSLLEDVQDDQTSKVDNGILKEVNNPTQSLLDPIIHGNQIESSTESPIHETTATLQQTRIETTTDYTRHVNSLQTMRDESTSVLSEEVIAPASVGRALNEIIAEGLGKPLPTRSVGDEPSSSSYSSEDKTTTVVVLCSAAGGIFIAFTVAIYLITFQRQNGTLDIEMQEQQCGKDDLDDDEDSQTRVSLLNQLPTVDSDEHSSD